MNGRSFTRRRVLAIAAAAGGLGLAGWMQRPQAATRWRGVALGAEASITLYHEDPATARRLLERARAEIARLEKVFSLYRADSAVARLNQDGLLYAPPFDLLKIVAEARRYAEATGGAFDITVQPLWQLYARHFAANPHAGEGPSAEDITAAIGLVDQRAIDFSSGQIAFTRPGMAITLNGIAQGYITDRVSDLLRQEGIDDVLVDLGEIRALGSRPGGEAWRIGIADPRDRDKLIETLSMRDRALATSAGSGSAFDGSGRYHHLFNPRQGNSTRLYASVSVTAARATTADALSTAFSAMSRAEIAAARPRLEPFEGLIMDNEGSLSRL